MFGTFNMGLGMLVIVPPRAASDIAAALSRAGEKVFEVGHVESRTGDDTAVQMTD